MPYKNRYPIELDAPPVGTDSLKSQIQDLGDALEVFDWVYEKIRGQSVIDELIKPLTGDFNRIRANGEAWKEIGQAFRKISDNQSFAVDKLRDEHWTEGAAARAFQSHIEVTWGLALQGAALGCDWIQKGFDLLADRAVQVGQAAIDLLEKLLKVLKKLALKLTGVGTVIGAAIDILSGDLPFKKDVKAAVDLIKAIIELKGKLEDLLASAKKFFAGAKMIANVLTSLPSVDSSHGAVDAIRGFREGRDGVQEARRDARMDRRDARKHLDEIKKITIGTG
jgi:hypothetical protein